MRLQYRTANSAVQDPFRIFLDLGSTGGNRNPETTPNIALFRLAPIVETLQDGWVISERKRCMPLASTQSAATRQDSDPTAPRRRRALRGSAAPGTRRVHAMPSAGRSDRQGALAECEIGQAAENIRRVAAYAELELALFYMMLATGARPLELARLRTHEVLTEDGTIRHRTQYAPFPPDSGASARPVFLESASVRRALSVYAAYRYNTHALTASTGAFRGLDPDSPFFVDPLGKPFEIEVTIGVRGDRYKCYGMLRTCRLVFRHTKLPGICVVVLRRTLARRLQSQGASLDEICLALGLKDRREARALLGEPNAVVRQRDLSEYFHNIVPDPEPDQSENYEGEPEEG